MSEDTSDLTVTLKAGTGFDAPWIVVRGDQPAEVVAKLAGLDSVIDATLEAAGKFVAGRAFPQGIVTGTPQDVTQHVERGASAPPAQRQQGWGQTPAAQQQGAAPAQQRPNRFGGQLHPEGKTCETCPQVLEKKQTGSGKNVWRCPEWRWNNGSPNGHSQEWID